MLTQQALDCRYVRGRKDVPLQFELVTHGLEARLVAGELRFVPRLAGERDGLGKRATCRERGRAGKGRLGVQPQGMFVTRRDQRRIGERVLTRVGRMPKRHVHVLCAQHGDREQREREPEDGERRHALPVHDRTLRHCLARRSRPPLTLIHPTPGSLLVKAIIYHNPRCSKSRQTLTLLQEHGVEVEIVEYLQTTPDARTLRRLLQALGMSAREVIRRGEAAYAALGLAGQLDDEAALIDAIVANPVLLERPIVLVGARAALGRPPEQVLSLLTDSM